MSSDWKKNLKRALDVGYILLRYRVLSLSCCWLRTDRFKCPCSIGFKSRSYSFDSVKRFFCFCLLFLFLSTIWAIPLARLPRKSPVTGEVCLSVSHQVKKKTPRWFAIVLFYYFFFCQQLLTRHLDAWKTKFFFFLVQKRTRNVVISNRSAFISCMTDRLKV